LAGVFDGGFGKSGVLNVVFLMVNLWWDCGELWSENAGFLTLKNMPLF
jgi:hypothetical protein